MKSGNGEALQLKPEGHSLKKYTEHFRKQLPNSHQNPLGISKEIPCPVLSRQYVQGVSKSKGQDVI